MKKFILCLFVTGLLVFQPAFAIGLTDAKTKRLVGETTSGYLAAVKSPSAEVKALINSINAKRKTEYKKIAKKNGASLQAVEALAGKTAINKTAPGQMIKLNGAWRAK